MYNTGNPVPSSALEDMADNAQTFDALVTKTDGTTTDRSGITRRVFQQILMDMGFQPLAGSFQTGATITARNQTLYDEVSHVFYAWGGTIPVGGYVVPAGSTPATAGGVGVGAWSDKTDLMVRSELSAIDGDSSTGYATYAQIRAYTGDKKSIRCGGRTFIYSGDGAHGKFYRDDTDAINPDDDGTILIDALGRRWKRKYVGEMVPAWFGTKGDGVNDDRSALQKAIDSCVRYSKNLRVRAGDKHLLNSYSGLGFASVLSVSGPISIFMHGAELITGTFFDNKEFITISMKGSDPSPTPIFDGFNLYGGKISFSGESSWSRSGFIQNRIGIHLGQAGCVRIRDVEFYNGDIVNAIKAGDGSFARKKDVQVISCTFRNLVANNPINSDYSAVYVKADESHVTDCVFHEESTQAAKVGCAVELHGNLTSWTGGSVKGLNKGCFLAALLQEGSVSGLTVSGVDADITNAFAYIWSEAGVSLTDALITGNNVKCRHITGVDSPYNNYQGILATSASSNDATTADGITVSNNKVKIVNTVISGRNTAMYMQLSHSGIRLLNNEFHNTPIGIKAAFVLSSMSAFRWHIEGNKFLSNGVVTDVFCDISGKADGVIYRKNEIFADSWTGTSRAFRVTGTASNCIVSVEPKDMLRATPAFGIEMPVALNKIFNVLFNSNVNYPIISAASHGLVSITHAALSSMYVSISGYDAEIQRSAPPSGLDIGRQFVGSGSSPSLLAYNHQVSPSSAANTSGTLLVTTY